MMDFFSVPQCPTNLLLAHKTMLIGIATHVSEWVFLPDFDKHVAMRRDGAPSLPVWVSLASLRANLAHARPYDGMRSASSFASRASSSALNASGARRS